MLHPKHVPFDTAELTIHLTLDAGAARFTDFVCLNVYRLCGKLFSSAPKRRVLEEVQSSAQTILEILTRPSQKTNRNPLQD